MESVSLVTIVVFATDLLLRVGLSIRVIMRCRPVGVSLAWQGLFTIDIEFRSETRNHWHVVLRPCPRAAKRLSAAEVARRWLTITKRAKCMTDELPVPDEERVQELAKDKKRIKTPRKQLGSISWFMAILSNLFCHVVGSCESMGEAATRMEASQLKDAAASRRVFK